MLPDVDYRKLIFIGFILVVLGAVIPWLMVLQVMESTFFWNFFAFAASITGLILGLIGAMSYAAKYIRRDRDK